MNQEEFLECFRAAIAALPAMFDGTRIETETKVRVHAASNWGRNAVSTFCPITLVALHINGQAFLPEHYDLAADSLDLPERTMMAIVNAADVSEKMHTRLATALRAIALRGKMKQKTYRVIARPRGSWRWQNAYSVVEYSVGVLANGTAVWKRTGIIVHKSSLPQLRRMGYSEIPRGGLHNKPVDRT